jgi:hypothetical protein
MKAILFIAVLFFSSQISFAQTTKKDSVNYSIAVLQASKDSLPLLIVDGKEKDYSYMQTLDTSLIQSVNIFSGKKAMKKYGKKAANGVVVVHTKRDPILQP